MAPAAHTTDSLRRFWPFGALAALLAGGCTPADVLNGLASTDGFEITHSISYGEGGRRTLDVYRPARATSAPVVVFFYGGSWQSGEKESYLFVAAALARRGYVTVVPDYRVYPSVSYPNFLDDGAAAVRWTKDNATRFGGDPDKLFLMGHSAGGYIAAMLTIDDRWLRKNNLDPHKDIAGLVGIAGAYDFLPLRDKTLVKIFGGANEPATQPITYVSAGLPPSLLVTGGNDWVVDPGNSRRLAKRLREKGNEAMVKNYFGVGHLGIVGAFAAPLRFLAPVLRDADRFMADTLSARRPAHQAARSAS